MNQRLDRVVATAALAFAILAGLFVASPKASAGTLNTSVLGMFPKEVGEFTYADMKSARKFAWFPQLRDQLLPSRFRQFEQFLTSAGIDTSSQVDEIAWGAVMPTKGAGEEIIGVALGSFSPSSSEDHFKQQKMPMIDDHGYHLYAFGSGSGAGDILFTFIDSNTAAFGHKSALEKLVDVRTGVSESLLSNDELFPLINEANGNGVIWSVLDKSYARLAMHQLVPQAGQFPQAAAIVDRIKAMLIYVEADSGIDAHFQAVCASTDDANLLSAALSAGLMYRRYQESQDHSALAAALDQVQVTPSGDRLRVDLPVSQDQLMALIRSRALAVKM
jgi:hypothetical protein